MPPDLMRHASFATFVLVVSILASGCLGHAARPVSVPNAPEAGPGRAVLNWTGTWKGPIAVQFQMVPAKVGSCSIHLSYTPSHDTPGWDGVLVTRRGPTDFDWLLVSSQMREARVHAPGVDTRSMLPSSAPESRDELEWTMDQFKDPTQVTIVALAAEKGGPFQLSLMCPEARLANLTAGREANIGDAGTASGGAGAAASRELPMGPGVTAALSVMDQVELSVHASHGQVLVGPGYGDAGFVDVTKPGTTVRYTLRPSLGELPLYVEAGGPGAYAVTFEQGAVFDSGVWAAMLGVEPVNELRTFLAGA